MIKITQKNAEGEQLRFWVCSDRMEISATLLDLVFENLTTQLMPYRHVGQGPNHKPASRPVIDMYVSLPECQITEFSE